MKHAALGERVTRERLIDWYRRGRERTEQIFRIPITDAYYDRPIALRNPIVFYEGHIPSFAVNTLIKLALHADGIDEDYEVLFARGIDPDSEAAVKNPTDLWPSRDAIGAYGRGGAALLGSARRTLVLARNVRARAAADFVAGLRHARGGGGVRELARDAAAERGGVSPRGLRHALGRGEEPPVGRGAAGRIARQ